MGKKTRKPDADSGDRSVGSSVIHSSFENKRRRRKEDGDTPLVSRSSRRNIGNLRRSIRRKRSSTESNKNDAIRIYAAEILIAFLTKKSSKLGQAFREELNDCKDKDAVFIKIFNQFHAIITQKMSKMLAPKIELHDCFASVRAMGVLPSLVVKACDKLTNAAN